MNIFIWPIGFVVGIWLGSVLLRIWEKLQGWVDVTNGKTIIKPSCKKQ